MRRSATACRNRFQRHLALPDTRRSGMPHSDTDCLIADDDPTGSWTVEEVTLLHQAMQAMEEEGKSSDNTPKFWKAVSKFMGNTRTRDQCRDKW